MTKNFNDKDFDKALAEQPTQQEPASVTYKEVTDAMNSLYAGDTTQVQIAMQMGSKKLYTSPPAQRKPLTLREIGAACGNFSDETIKVVRQTEAAHNTEENT